MSQPRNHQPSSISAVIPCFNEEDVLDELLKRLHQVLSTTHLPYEIILVDDGSSDRTWELIHAARSTYPAVKGIKLARNFGHQLALTAGLDQAQGEVIIILDADLQDSPELLTPMLEKWREGYDVVYGQRLRRAGETFFKKFSAYTFYRLLNQVTKIDIPRDTGDFRLLDRKALDALRSLRERHRFVRGMVSWIGYKQCPIQYDRPARFKGETKYPLMKSLKLAFDAIFSFSMLPLRMATYLGTTLCGIGVLYLVVMLALSLMGRSASVNALLATVLLLGGVQLVAVGILGEYIGRLFEQSQGRPLYLVEEVEGEPMVNTFTEKKTLKLAS